MDASDKVSLFLEEVRFLMSVEPATIWPLPWWSQHQGKGQTDEQPMSQHLSVWRLSDALHVSASEMKGRFGQRNIYLYNPVFLLMKVGLMAGTHGDFWLSQTKDDHHGGHCSGSKMVDWCSIVRQVQGQHWWVFFIKNNLSMRGWDSCSGLHLLTNQ